MKAGVNLRTNRKGRKVDYGRQKNMKELRDLLDEISARNSG
jgi:hypothetical protein